MNGEYEIEDTLPKMGVVLPQLRRCGKAKCRCASGDAADLHGPYHYRFWRESGRLRKRYVSPAEVETVRAACRRRQDEGRVYRAQRDAARAHLRRLRDRLAEHPDLTPYDATSHAAFQH